MQNDNEKQRLNSLNLNQRIKSYTSFIAHYINLNSVLRYKNRGKLLVLMYHGVTDKVYMPPVWSQLYVSTFERHLNWISKNYTPVTLNDVVASLTREKELPERSVLVTFDDGLKNNYSVAYPLLKKYNIPSAIFLTVDFVGTSDLFWVDELWLTIKEAGARNVVLDLNDDLANVYYRNREYWNAYHSEVESLKLISETEREDKFNYILEQFSIHREEHLCDFGVLTWDDVIDMDQDGLVDFGVHTATHRILTTISKDDLDDELFGAKNRLEKKLGHPVDAFCYPNGRFGFDYSPEHRDILRNGGYKCAFSTDTGLCAPGSCHNFSIPRVAAASDVLADSYFFYMYASGACEYLRRK